MMINGSGHGQSNVLISCALSFPHQDVLVRRVSLESHFLHQFLSDNLVTQVIQVEKELMVSQETLVHLEFQDA